MLMAFQGSHHYSNHNLRQYIKRIQSGAKEFPPYISIYISHL